MSGYYIILLSAVDDVLNGSPRLVVFARNNILDDNPKILESLSRGSRSIAAAHDKHNNLLPPSKSSAVISGAYKIM